MNENSILNSSFKWRWCNSNAWSSADVCRLDNVSWINSNILKASYDNKEVFIKRFPYQYSYIKDYIYIVDSLIDNGIVTPRVRVCPRVLNAIELDILSNYTCLTSTKSPLFFVSQLSHLIDIASNSNWNGPPSQFSPWEFARDIQQALEFLSNNVSYGCEKLNKFLINIGSNLKISSHHSCAVHHVDMSPGNFVLQDSNKIIFLDITPAVSSSINVYANAFYWLCLHPSGPWNSRENAAQFIIEVLHYNELNLEYIFRAIIEVMVVCYLISMESKESEHGWPALNGHIRAVHNILEWLEYFVSLNLVKPEDAMYYLSRAII